MKLREKIAAYAKHLTILNRKSELSMFAMVESAKGDFLYSTFVMKLKNGHFICCKLEDIEECREHLNIYFRFQSLYYYDFVPEIRNTFENSAVSVGNNGEYRILFHSYHESILTDVRKFVKKFCISDYSVIYE